MNIQNRVTENPLIIFRIFVNTPGRLHLNVSRDQKQYEKYFYKNSFRPRYVVGDEGLGVIHFSYRFCDKMAFPWKRLSKVLNTMITKANDMQRKQDKIHKNNEN